MNFYGYMVLVLYMASFLANGFSDYGWKPATATFYGGPDGIGTMYGGACGYGNLWNQGYGLENTALSTALFDDGFACGACYEIQCINSKSCHPGSVKVTATNLCPSGEWCEAPKIHFDLSQPMFAKIGDINAGWIPVLFHRVSCAKLGGIKFEINGNPYFTLVLVSNVGGAGDVHEVSIKGSNTGWIKMWRNWGQNWQIGSGTQLPGQSLSFQVSTGDGKMVQSDGVAPANWQFGQTYEGKQF